MIRRKAIYIMSSGLFPFKFALIFTYLLFPSAYCVLSTRNLGIGENCYTNINSERILRWCEKIYSNFPIACLLTVQTVLFTCQFSHKPELFPSLQGCDTEEYSWFKFQGIYLISTGRLSFLRHQGASQRNFPSL